MSTDLPLPADGYVLPTPGQWYDDSVEFARLDPASRPRRPAEPSDANDYRKNPGPDRVRQRLRSRPSTRPLAPWGGKYYWCAFCNYVNTEDEGQSVRCPRHRAEWNRTRQQVRRAGGRAVQRRSEDAPALVLTWADLRDLQGLASASSRAGTYLGRVIDGPEGRDMRVVLREARQLLSANRDLALFIHGLFERVGDEPTSD